MSETPQTITLSDTSVWEYAPKGKAPRGMLPRCHWAVLFRDGRKTGYGSPHLLDPMAQLTASDYRKIADVLQPPAARPKLEAEWRSKLTAIRQLVDLAKSYPETAQCKTAKRTLEALNCAAEELATLPAFPVADPPRESEDTARMTRAQAIAVWNKCNPDLSFDALLPSQRGRLLKYADEIEIAAREVSK